MPWGDISPLLPLPSSISSSPSFPSLSFSFPYPSLHADDEGGEEEGGWGMGWGDILLPSFSPHPTWSTFPFRFSLPPLFQSSLSPLSLVQYLRPLSTSAHQRLFALTLLPGLSSPPLSPLCFLSSPTFSPPNISNLAPLHNL